MTALAWKPPSQCHACGAAFPWTEARQKALADLLALAGASESEETALSASIPALASSSPEAPVAVAGGSGTSRTGGKQLASALREVLVEAASEAAKKAVFP